MRRGRTRRGTVQHAGFSILELLVVLAIVSAALAIAARLMLEAQRRSVIEQRRAYDVAVPLALEQLRLDVTAAAGGSGDAGRGEPLTLTLPSGVVIGYQLADGELVRTYSDPAGQRVALREVSDFRWQWLGGDKPLVVIELAYAATRSSGPEAIGGRRVVVPRGLERRTLSLTLRGGGGVGW